MPRPVDTSSETFRKTVIIGGVAVGIAVVVGVGALVGFSSASQPEMESESSSDADSSGEQVSLVDEEQTAENAASSLVVDGLDKLKFLDRDAQASFKQALYSYCSSNGIELANPAILNASETEKAATAAKIVLKVNDSDYLICYWVANTSSPFMFEQATSNQVNTMTSDEDDSDDDETDDSTVDPQTGNTESNDDDEEDDTDSSTVSSSSAASSSKSSNSSSSSSSPNSVSASSSNKSTSSKSSTKAQTGRTSAAKNPVKASDSEKLAKKLPEKAAYYLPTVIENYLAKKGFSVDGSTVTIDYSSIKKSSVGYALYGYVTDDSGEKHYLDMEWNAKKEKFGINTYTKD